MSSLLAIIRIIPERIILLESLTMTSTEVALQKWLWESKIAKKKVLLKSYFLAIENIGIQFFSSPKKVEKLLMQVATLLSEDLFKI